MARSANKTTATTASVDSFIAQLTQQQQQDARQLCQAMSDITGHPPVMWGPSIIGFDQYHYKYESGRQGDMAAIGFSPRQGKISIYLVDGAPKYQLLLDQLGPHQVGKACLYVKRLSDIDLSVLRELIAKSVADMQATAS